MKSSICVRALIVAAGLGAGGGAFAPAYAETSPSAASSTAVGEVVVTGRLEEELPTQLAKQGVRVDVVTAEQIKNGGYIDIAQSLETTVPGLYLSPKNGPFDYVQASLQGSGTSDILWLVDGVRINNRLYAGTTPLDTLPASMVERIDVVEGSQALFYGTQSVAGAINVITRQASLTPTGAVTVGGDSNGGSHVDGFFSDTVWKNHFVAYGSWDVSGGYQPFPTQDYQPSGTDRRRAYNMATVGIKDAYDLTGDLRLSVSEQHTQGRVDDAGAFQVATAYNERDEDILTGKVDYTPSDKLQLFVKGYYHWWRSHYTEFDNDLANPGTIDVVEDHGPWGFNDGGLNALAKFEPIPQLDAYLGYDFQSYSGSDAVLVIAQHSENVHAVFGELVTTPALIPGLSLSAGFRYNAPSVGAAATVGNVSARWDVNDDLYLKATAGTAFRLPTAEELFADDPQDERGNPDLRPETSTNANLSVGGRLFGRKSVHWEVVGFYREIKNLIDYESFDAMTNQDVFGNVPGTVHVRGGEVILEGAATDSISGSASYTYSSSTESGDSRQLVRIPQSLAKASIDYHPTDHPFGASASLNYVGQTSDDLGGALPTRVQYGNYVVVNASVRVFLGNDRRHRIDLIVNNLLDKQYAASLGFGLTDATGDPYPVSNLGQPRTFLARYTYSF